MTHPGVAVMVMVAVGIGACLYYLFADDNTQGHHQYRHEGGNFDSSPSNHYDPWLPDTDDRLRRRKRSNANTGKLSCTICLTDLGDEESVQMLACGHQFHKRCITEWRTHGPEQSRNNCPNCRERIFGSGSKSA